MSLRIQIIGPSGSDARVLRIAAALEQLFAEMLTQLGRWQICGPWLNNKVAG